MGEEPTPSIERIPLSLQPPQVLSLLVDKKLCSFNLGLVVRFEARAFGWRSRDGHDDGKRQRVMTTRGDASASRDRTDHVIAYLSEQTCF